MRWTRDTPTDEGVGSRTAKSCGPDIPTLMSSWRQCLLIALMMVANKPGSPGRARHRPLKPFACGNAGLHRRTCGDLLVSFVFRHEAAGALEHPVFPAPSVIGGTSFQQSPGDKCRGDARFCLPNAATPYKVTFAADELQMATST